MALEPDGDVRWTLARPDVRFPRWGGTRTDTRIAYLSDGELRVVGGNGKGDRLLDSQAADRAPVWRPGAKHVLIYERRDGSIRVVDVDTGAELEGKAGGAFLRQADLALAHDLLGAGDFATPVRSPNGRWLAVGWPEADQFVFVRATGGRRIRARFGRLSAVPLTLLPYDRGVVLHALIVAALLAAPAEQLGRSSEGRPIDVVHIAGAGQRILVVGCIHGDECEGIEVTKILARSKPTADLWLVHQLNPDGSHAETG